MANAGKQKTSPPDTSWGGLYCKSQKTTLWDSRPQTGTFSMKVPGTSIWPVCKIDEGKRPEPHVTTFEIKAVKEHGLKPRHMSNIEIPMNSESFESGWLRSLQTARRVLVMAIAAHQTDEESELRLEIPVPELTKTRFKTLMEASKVIQSIVFYGETLKVGENIHKYMPGFAGAGYALPRPDLSDNSLGESEILFVPGSTTGNKFSISEIQEDLVELVNLSVYGALYPLVKLNGETLVSRTELTEENKEVLIKVLTEGVKLMVSLCNSKIWARSNEMKRSILEPQLAANTYKSQSDEFDVMHLGEVACLATQVAKGLAELENPFRLDQLFEIFMIVLKVDSSDLDFPIVLELLREQLQCVPIHPEIAYSKVEDRLIDRKVSKTYVVEMKNNDLVPVYRCVCPRPGFICHVKIDLKKNLNLKVINDACNSFLEELRPVIRQCYRLECAVAGSLFYLCWGRGWYQRHCSSIVDLSEGLTLLAEGPVVIENLLANLRLNNELSLQWNRSRLFVTICNRLLDESTCDTRAEGAHQSIGFGATANRLDVAGFLLRFTDQFMFCLPRKDSTIPIIGYNAGESTSGLLPGCVSLSGLFTCDSLLKKLDKSGMPSDNCVKVSLIKGSKGFVRTFTKYLTKGSEIAVSELESKISLVNRLKPQCLSTLYRLSQPAKVGEKHGRVLCFDSVPNVVKELVGNCQVPEPPRILMVRLYYFASGRLAPGRNSHDNLLRLDIFRRLMSVTRTRISNNLGGKSLLPLFSELGLSVENSMFMLGFSYLTDPLSIAFRDVMPTDREGLWIFDNQKPYLMKENPVSLYKVLESMVTPKKSPVSCLGEICQLCLNTGLNGEPHCTFRCIDKCLVGIFSKPTEESVVIKDRVGPALLNIELPALRKCTNSRCELECVNHLRCSICACARYCSQSCYIHDYNKHRGTQITDDGPRLVELPSECENMAKSFRRATKKSVIEKAQERANQESLEKYVLEKARDDSETKNEEVWTSYLKNKVDFFEDRNVSPESKLIKLTKVIAAATFRVRKIMIEILSPLINKDKEKDVSTMREFMKKNQFERLKNYIRHSESYAPDLSIMLTQPDRFSNECIMANFVLAYGNFWSCISEFVAPWHLQSLAGNLELEKEPPMWGKCMSSVQSVARELFVTRLVIADQIEPWIRTVRLREMSVRKCLIINFNRMLTEFHNAVGVVNDGVDNILLHAGYHTTPPCYACPDTSPPNWRESFPRLPPNKPMIELMKERSEIIGEWELLKFWLQVHDEDSWPDISSEDDINITDEFNKIPHKIWWVNESSQSPGVLPTSIMRVTDKMIQLLKYLAKMTVVFRSANRVYCTVEELMHVDRTLGSLANATGPMQNKVTEICGMLPAIKEIVRAADDQGLKQYLTCPEWLKLPKIARENMDADFLRNPHSSSPDYHEIREGVGYPACDRNTFDPVNAIKETITRLADPQANPRTNAEIEVAKVCEKLLAIPLHILLKGWFMSNDQSYVKKNKERFQVGYTKLGKPTNGEGMDCYVKSKMSSEDYSCKYFEVTRATKGEEFILMFERAPSDRGPKLFYCKGTDSEFEVSALFLNRTMAASTVDVTSPGELTTFERTMSGLYLNDWRVSEHALYEATGETESEDEDEEDDGRYDLPMRVNYSGGIYGPGLIVPPVISRDDWQGSLINRATRMQQDTVKLIDGRRPLINPIPAIFFKENAFVTQKSVLNTLLVKSRVMSAEMFKSVFEKQCEEKNNTGQSLTIREAMDDLMDKFYKKAGKDPAAVDVMRIIGYHH